VYKKNAKATDTKEWGVVLKESNSPCRTIFTQKQLELFDFDQSLYYIKSNSINKIFTPDVMLIAIDTLQVLASQLSITNGLIIPMIDARRMEVYSAIFNSEAEKIREVQAEIITEESFLKITEPIHFVGDCLEKAKTVLTNPNFIFHDEIVYPSAKEMGFFSYKKFKEKDFEDVAYFEPYYLKDFMITVSKK
jgi:tRNA threonylcarbamoyladenosine biosynthesis protein TsaB